MNAFWDWLGRVVMLVLAGMVTLSIIGALASISSQQVGTRPVPVPGDMPVQWSQPTPSRPPAPVPSPVPEPEMRPAPAPAPVPPPTASPPAGAPGVQGTLAPAPEPEPDIAEWLEAITYALLAIAGLLALGLLLLVRALGHWRRSADALERPATRP